ncbi:hypothetical protein XH98_30270 [Bradyrhizobium sp. CCBAU 51745]|nr:hypothetical protein [Bradyrhizobium sp. CCBAU 51745]
MEILDSRRVFDPSPVLLSRRPEFAVACVTARIAAASMIGSFEDGEAIVDFRQSLKKANAN